MSELINFPDRNVCILGLGYVGLTLAVAMADVGFTVVGVEIRDEVLESLQNGDPHFHEPGLNGRLKRVVDSGKLRCVKSIPEDWEGTVFIITVGTPLDSNGVSRMDMIENVSREVAERISDGALVIMRSTVKLGVTRECVNPLIAASGKKFDLAFCPERTLEGKALLELRELPQIVGGFSNQAGVRASQLFQFITPTVIRVGSVETAEMIKLIDNTQRDVHFAFANEVARACDAVGVSAEEVIRAGKTGYPRTNLPMPGPVGGPCLEKDPHILVESIRQYGVDLEITAAARRTNEDQPEEIVSFIKSLVDEVPSFSKVPKVTLMGLAFKGQPATDDLRGTMAIPVLASLRNAFEDAVFCGYDPVVSRAAVAGLGLEPLGSIDQAFEQSSLVLILNNHPEFGAMEIEELTKNMCSPGIVYDFWNFFKVTDLHLPAAISYVALGSHKIS